MMLLLSQCQKGTSDLGSSSRGLTSAQAVDFTLLFWFLNLWVPNSNSASPWFRGEVAGQPSDVLLGRPSPGAKQGWCFPLPAVLRIVPIKYRRSGRVRAAVPCQASCLLVTEGRAPSGGAEGVCPHIRRRAVRTFSARYKLVVSHHFFFFPLSSLFAALSPSVAFLLGLMFLFLPNSCNYVL